MKAYVSIVSSASGKNYESVLSISPADVICCGDSYNDIGMLRYAGTGVAMANAPENVKSFADYVTHHSDDEQGIVEVARRFFPSRVH